ncbi:SRPBCC family protein [Streptomyces iconiensis]|uniref:SRPBCC family protein n=1 Tax=Streptomyces iconiensis TaxID=1384038 RepID=A0ABT7A534_9ACTN|nr:SRPBCC family protein [Streptomyces iconiensis]MDJ1136134.1 SRPBCC family protein [Streptomyces iconiensis]
MGTSGTAKVTFPADEQVLITREFEAPRHLVYRAWTTPDLVKRWWAGQQGTMTSVEIDLRVGGQWRYVMNTNGGEAIAFHGEFQEIVPDERLVNTEVFELGPSEGEQPALVTTEFADAGEGRTALTLLSVMPNKESRDAMIDAGMEHGMQQQMDLLEGLAASLA